MRLVRAPTHQQRGASQPSGRAVPTELELRARDADGALAARLAPLAGTGRQAALAQRERDRERQAYRVPLLITSSRTPFCLDFFFFALFATFCSVHY